MFRFIPLTVIQCTDTNITSWVSFLTFLLVVMVTDAMEVNEGLINHNGEGFRGSICYVLQHSQFISLLCITLFLMNVDKGDTLEQ